MGFWRKAAGSGNISGKRKEAFIFRGLHYFLAYFTENDFIEVILVLKRNGKLYVA